MLASLVSCRGVACRRVARRRVSAIGSIAQHRIGVHRKKKSSAATESDSYLGRGNLLHFLSAIGPSGELRLITGDGGKLASAYLGGDEGGKRAAGDEAHLGGCL